MKKAVFIILCMAVFMPFAVEARTCEYGIHHHQYTIMEIGLMDK